MSQAAANGIHIEYETIGDPAARPHLLIGGLADQLIHWDDRLCEDHVRRGHYVIRFDNRDAGLATKCGGAVDPTRRAGAGKGACDDMTAHPDSLPVNVSLSPPTGIREAFPGSRLVALATFCGFLHDHEEALAAYRKSFSHRTFDR